MAVFLRMECSTGINKNLSLPSVANILQYSTGPTRGPSPPTYEEIAMKKLFAAALCMGFFATACVVTDDTCECFY
ncbi:hypothetical protein KKD52_14595, partial [Myxococcota bacterium]|nr:hypothetical protein [Myxococcota bacterium]